ncbi:MAG: calcineurin-like phosphoesterase C-terminal domain-containing protein [Bacteroidales bacterium]|nr:calcineurin-like phosphoesterase C-terminal domain-containing protein [Bacteroidales bacterium]
MRKLVPAILLLFALSCGKDNPPAGEEQGGGTVPDTTQETINGTKILSGNNRVGLVTDSSTGKGIPGVPVTDGYKYTLTDANGVYQFAAHEDARCVYLSLPRAYEIPLAKDGEPLFWKTGAYRNDFSLTPRAEDWTEYSVLAFTDVHFYDKGASSTVETERYNARTLKDINACVSALDKVIILNTGDLVTNVTEKLASSRAEFAKIKKGGVTVPMFPTIGNHDFNNAFSSTLACSEDWFKVYGPLDYSVNIGKTHIVCLNDVQFSYNNDGGYGKAIGFEKGLTDAQWAWLQADLNTVSDKAGTLLLICVHCPVFANDFAHAGDIRNLLRTFGESHIFSGHNHYNVHRQFADTWKGLSGRLSEEHNMAPLGGLWRSSLGNDGSPNGYHEFRINGNAIVRQTFKAVGSEDASYQFRIYDGGASYHAPVSGKYDCADADGKLYFDWKTLLEGSEGVDPTDKILVRVFDAGTRGLNCNVYYNKDGVRYKMTHLANAHRDQCTFSYFWNGGVSLNSAYAAAYNGGKTQGFWYYDASPSGEGWKVEVEFKEAGGSRWYESSTIQKDYTGFAW